MPPVVTSPWRRPITRWSGRRSWARICGRRRSCLETTAAAGLQKTRSPRQIVAPIAERPPRHQHEGLLDAEPYCQCRLHNDVRPSRNKHRDSRCAALQRTAQRRCHDRLCIGIRCDCQWTDMTPGGDVGITDGAAGVLDPDRARREAAKQKLVMQISAEPEQLLIDPANPFASVRPGRNRCDVVTGIDKVLRYGLRRRGHFIERLARIEAVL